MNYSEECFCIKNEGEYIRGIIHKNNNNALLIYCPGLAGDRVDCHRIPVEFGRLAARNGWDLVRFEYRGIGVSDGNTIMHGFNDIISDIEMIIQEFSSKYERIGLIGISQACIQTFYIASICPKVDTLMLWSPVFDKDNRFEISDPKKSDTVVTPQKRIDAKVWDNDNEELYKGKQQNNGNSIVRISRKFKRERKSGLFGYPNTGMWISSKYYEERKHIIKECICFTNKISKRIGLFKGEFDDSVSEDAITCSIAERVGMVVIPEGDHLFSEDRCKRYLFDKSIEWLNGR